MDSNVLSTAWGPHRQRFSEAMRQARSEIGPGGSFTAVVRKAWAIDPCLRGQFGSAVSAGLRKMWANSATRAEQSDRIKQSYTQSPSLRRLRSEGLKANWANTAFRERMMRALRARGRAGEQPNKEKAV